MRRRSGCTRERAFQLATRHRAYDKRLHEAVLRQDPLLVENCATEEARRMHDMQRAVMRCLQAKKGFLRLRKAAGKILYARTELEHDVLDLLVRHFRHRFPTYHIIIQSGHRTQWTGPGNAITEECATAEEIVRRIEAGNRQEAEIPSDTGEAWRRYYDSQDIEGRRDIRLQEKMMPLKHRDPDALETFRALRCRTLPEFT